MAVKPLRSYKEFLRERLPRNREAAIFERKDPNQLGVLLATAAIETVARRLRDDGAETEITADQQVLA